MNAIAAWLGAAACASACAITQASATQVADADPPVVVSMVDRTRENGVWKRKCPSQAANVRLCHPALSAGNGKYSLALTALIQADAATFDRADVAGAEGAPLRSRSGFDVRRAQIGVQGRLGADFEYRFNYDFSGASVQSAFLSYRGILDPFIFRMGAFPTPANLADASAADDLLFGERASPSQLSRSLDAGDGRESIGFQGSGAGWYLSSYLTSNTFGKAQIADQKAYVGRVAIAPVRDATGNFTLHLGGNLGYVFDPAGASPAACAAKVPDCSLVSFSDRPELREWNVSWIGSGSIDAKSAFSAGIEGALGYGRLLLEGEFFRYGIDRRHPADGQTNPGFSGWYIEGSWVVTGEERVYSMSNAAFLRPVPASNFDPSGGSWGAWEFALRYSDTDLDYDAGSLVTADQIRGGDQRIVSAGLNFYPAYNLKCMFDWQNVAIRRPWSGALDIRYNAFSMRAQISL